MKKKILLVLLLVIAAVTNSQEKNSLLWKISGNGLVKDSYLYGTMHVSEKIAFHLDDVFYQSLLKSDFIGLETDPSFWLDQMVESEDLLRGFRDKGGDFYSNSFKINTPKINELLFFLTKESNIVNGILYRTNPSGYNYQEDTYLDMFIFQSGKKFGKKIHSLENIDKAKTLVSEAVIDPSKRKPDLWLQKELKDKNFFTLLSNTYRNRNVELIDSINHAMYNKSYLKNMLYIRNVDMVNSIDSIAKKGSLFSAVGAAHLGGEKGIINLLREKGYTVTSLTSKKTVIAEQLKSKIEDKQLDIVYENQKSLDHFFSAKVPTKLYEFNLLGNTIYLSPDLANGAYIIVSRVNTFSYLKEKIKLDDDFYKLLEESVPGKIISKKEIENNGIKGLDIVNKTKSGDYQRYFLFFTPLELLTFKMSGEKDFVLNHGGVFFDSIQLKKEAFVLETVEPEFGGFSVQLPKSYIFSNKKNSGDRLIQAYDKNKDYYFLKEIVNNDVYYLEEDNFELERIHQSFYKDLELDYLKGSFNSKSNYNTFESKGKFPKEDKYLHLKTVIRGGHYFLLGKVSKAKEKPSSFFNSFKLTDFKYKEEDFKEQKDTALYFSAKTNIKPPTYKNYRRKKEKDYQGFFKVLKYRTKTNEEIFVQLKKEHDLVGYVNIDSLKNYTEKKEIYKYDYYNDNTLNKLLNKKRLYIANSKNGKDKYVNDYFSYDVKDSLSSRVIKVKNVISNGAVYQLRTLVDTTYKTSAFITNFYTTFKPKDTVIGTSLFTSKTAIFFDLLKKKDSIAIDGYDVVNFDKKDVDKLISVIRDFKFDRSQQKIRKNLLNKLSRHQSKKVDDFFIDLYNKSYDKPQDQIIVFNYFSKQKTKKAYETLLRLLEKDIPLSTNKYDISNMFREPKEALNLAKNLFPDLLNYATIDEYKKTVYKLLSTLLDDNMIKPKVYKSFKKQILNEAKIELKRQLSKKQNQADEYDSYSSRYAKEGVLKNYVTILYPFKSEKSTSDFLLKLKKAKNIEANTTYLKLQIQNKDAIDKELLLESAKNINSRGVLYQKLKEIKKQNYFPKRYLEKEKIYKSLLFKRNSTVENKDSIVFLKKRSFDLHAKKYEAFFFKSKPDESINSYRDKDWKLSFIIFEDKANTISSEPVYKSREKVIDETKTIEDIIDRSLEKVLLSNRKRAGRVY